MLDSIDARELAEWRAFASLEPIGGERSDLQAGIVAASIYNANPWRKRGTPPVRPSKLMPDWDKAGRKKGINAKALKASLMAYTVAMGGKVVQRGDGR